MENQKSLLLPPTQIGRRPSKWEERFLIKRIGEDDIEITLGERDAILKALDQGQKYIQVKKYTLMLNGIKSIDPKWGEKNIPPKPRPITERVEEYVGSMAIIRERVENQREIEEWEALFGKEEI